MTFHCTDSFEYEDWSMKHPNLENEAPKNSKMKTSRSKMKHPKLENEAPENSKPEIDLPFVVVEILYEF